MNPKALGATVLCGLALMAITASSANATTLEVGGVAKNASVSLEWSLRAPVTFEDTFGTAANTCTVSLVRASTSSPFTGTTVSAVVNAMSFGNCAEGNPTPDALGTITIERIGTTTNGTVRLSGTKLTVPSFFGTLTCTASNTDIGILTGVASGNSQLDGSGVLSCTVIGTMKFQWPMVATSPAGLGVTS